MRLRPLALVLVGVLAVAGCSTHVPGTAVAEPAGPPPLMAPAVPTLDPDALTGSSGQWQRAICAQGTYRSGTTLTHVTNGGTCTSVVDPSETLRMAHTTLDDDEQNALYDELRAGGATFGVGAVDEYGLEVIVTSAPTQAPLEPLLAYNFRIDPF